MANVKITDLTAASAAAKSMLFEVTQDPGGTPATRKLTLTQLLDLDDGTKTASAPLINMAQTWNSGGVTFTAMKINITDTASAAASLIADFQLGGVSQFSIKKTGICTAGLQFRANYLAANSDLELLSDTSVLYMGASGDLQFRREGAGVFAQRNSTSAQTLRVYNTYTDTSNYERGVFDWQTTSNNLTIGTQHAGTGSARAILFATGSTNRWLISASGDLITWVDNTYDIGASGANRPRDLFVGGGVTTGNPSGGTAAKWKLGTLVTAAVTPDTTRYIELDVAGTLYKLIVAS